MPTRRLALKIDVDTERGTRVGVPALVRLLRESGAPATFYFSLGPDRTGRALRRMFRRGFVAKAARTNVIATYGLRTLGNGVLWPGPRIARRHAGLLAAVRDAGFEVGVHCWDHVRWQDGLHRMSAEQVRAELGRALEAFEQVFRTRAASAAAAGWQASAHSLEAYDEAGLGFASDARGSSPFRPSCGGRVFRTPQIPTTLPTLDELIGRPDWPEERLIPGVLELMRPDALEVMTIHAEIEGMRRLDWFARFLAACREAKVGITSLGEEARSLGTVPVCELVARAIPGRSGTVATQAGAVGP